MKLKNPFNFDLKIIQPFDQLVKAGETIEVDKKEKQLIKDLKAVGFEEVKEVGE
ncbi:hypothetical protein [Bacillus cereus group sp. IBL03679]|uniref:hypothetical protein n=1 Tax=Bacillus cereus group sp. IBL03679 TaxID=3240095 RepID=UPI003D2F7657